MKPILRNDILDIINAFNLVNFINKMKIPQGKENKYAHE